MNASNVSAGDVVQLWLSSATGQSMQWVMIAISVWVITVNLLALVTAARSHLLDETRYVLIKSLTVVDFLTGLVQLMRAVLMQVFRGREPFLQCAVTTTLVFSFSSASFLHMTAIAVERYVAVTRPLHYATIFTPRRFAGILLLVWVWSFAGSFLALTIVRTEWAYDGTCHAVIIFPALVTVTSVGIFFGAFALQGALYLRMYLIARNHERKIASEVSRFNSTAASTTPAVATPSKSWKTPVYIFVAALVSFTPHMLLSLLLAGVEDTAQRDYLLATTATVTLLFANSGMNFVIFVMRDTVFRNALVNTLCPKARHLSDRS